MARRKSLTPIDASTISLDTTDLANNKNYSEAILPNEDLDIFGMGAYGDIVRLNLMAGSMYFICLKALAKDEAFTTPLDANSLTFICE